MFSDILFIKEPIKAFPDYKLLYVVHIDASAEGLGAVLSQKQVADLKIILYALHISSPSCGKSETVSHKGEFRDKIK